MAPRRHLQRGLCRIAEQYLKKGSKVYLEGALQTRKWQDQSGQDKYSTEVVLQGFNSQLTMLDRAGGGGGEIGSDDTGGGDFGSSGPRRASASRRWRAPANAATWTTRFRFDGARPDFAAAQAAQFRQSRKRGVEVIQPNPMSRSRTALPRPDLIHNNKGPAARRCNGRCRTQLHLRGR